MVPSNGPSPLGPVSDPDPARDMGSSQVPPKTWDKARDQLGLQFRVM